MSRRVLLLAASCALLAVAMLLIHPQPAQPGETATVQPGAPTTAARSAAAGSAQGNPQSPDRPQVTSWQPQIPEPWAGPSPTAASMPESWPARTFDALRSAAVGDSVTLHWPGRPAWQGIVTLHATSEHGLMVGASGDHEVLDLHWDPEGGLRGRVWFTGAAVAWQLHSDGTGPLLVTVVDLSDLICAPRGSSYPAGLGLRPAEAVAGDEPAPATAPVSGTTPASTSNFTVRLNSKPGASRVLWLDFDGGTVTGTSWNTTYTSGHPIVVEPSAYDAHQRTMIWRRTADDFAAFDINVTTDPSVFAAAPLRNRVRVIITPTASWYPASNVIGIALLGTYGTTSPNNAWVFEGRTSGSQHAADVISHEAGHTFGLQHHGTASQEYYSGQGQWKPIMGNSGGRDVAQWARGEYAGANRPNQHDLEVIVAAGLPRRADDHGNTIATASRPAAESIAPGLRWRLDGVIESQADVDVFQVDVPATGTLWWDLWPEAHSSSAVLASELRRADGSLVATAASGTTNWASGGELQVPAGSYFLWVRGSGRGDPQDTGFSAYGSVGSYGGHVGWNAPRANAFHFTSDSHATTNTSDYRIIKVRFRNLGSVPATFRLESDPPGMIIDQTYGPISPGGHRMSDVPAIFMNLPLGTTEGQLVARAVDGTGSVRVPLQLAVSGDLARTELRQSPDLLTVLDMTDPPLLRWVFEVVEAAPDAWQQHSITPSDPDLLINPAEGISYPVNQIDRYAGIVRTFNRFLPPGTYQGTFTFRARVGTPGYPYEVPYSFTIPVPNLRLNATALDNWSTSIGQSTVRTVSLLQPGSPYPFSVQLSSTTPWLGYSPNSGSPTYNSSFQVYPNQDLPVGTHPANLTFTVVGNPTVTPQSITLNFNLVVNPLGEITTDPPALDWTVTPVNQGSTTLKVIPAPGATSSTTVTLTTDLPNLSLHSTSVTLNPGSSGRTIQMSYPSETLAVDSSVSGKIDIRLDNGTLALTVPVTVRRGGPTGDQPAALAPSESSQITSPLSIGRWGSFIEVHLRGLRTPDASSVRAVLWPPEGPPVSLLAGAARGSSWDGLDLIFTPSDAPIPEAAVNLTSGARVGPSDYLTPHGTFAWPPSSWPPPPYGRPLHDVLGSQQDGQWRLWIDGIALPGGPLLAGGWKVVVDSNQSVMRPRQAWLPGDITSGIRSIDLRVRTLGTLNATSGLGENLIRLLSSTHWVEWTQNSISATSNPYLRWLAEDLAPGIHTSQISLENFRNPRFSYPIRVDLRAWAPGDWGGSWTGPAWEVSPSQPVAESPINLTGWAKFPHGLEVHLAGLETADAAGLKLTLVGPDGREAVLKDTGSAPGWKMGDLRILSVWHPDFLLQHPDLLTTQTLLAPAAGSTENPAGVRSWSGRNPIGRWSLRAEWDPTRAGGARARDGWALRLHTLRGPIGPAPEILWLSAAPGTSASTRMTFHRVNPGSGSITPLSADPAISVQPLGGDDFLVTANAASVPGILHSTLSWQVANDPSSPYLTPITVRTGPTDWSPPRGPGQLIADQGPALRGPSPLEIRGLRGPIRSLTVRIHGLSSPKSLSLRAVLESPEGRITSIFEELRFGPDLTLAQLALQGTGTAANQSALNNEITTLPPQNQRWVSRPEQWSHLSPIQFGFGHLVGRRANGVWRLHLADVTEDGLQSQFAGWDLAIETDPGYELWQQAMGVGEPGEDDDGDGISNLQEWYFGTDPRVANPANGPFLPQPQVVTTDTGVERLSLSLRRRILARSVVETSAETWSPTTGTWLPVPIQSTTTTADPDPEFEQVTLLLNLPPSPHLIARLRLTL